MCAECDSFFSEDDAFALGEIFYNHTFDLNEEDFMFIPQTIDIPEITPPLLPAPDDRITDSIANGEMEEPMQKWQRSVFRPTLPRLLQNLRIVSPYRVVPYNPIIADIAKHPWRNFLCLLIRNFPCK